MLPMMLLMLLVVTLVQTMLVLVLRLLPCLSVTVPILMIRMVLCGGGAEPAALLCRAACQLTWHCGRGKRALQPPQRHCASRALLAHFQMFVAMAG